MEQILQVLRSLALILLKLFCKRIYDQKRRLEIIVTTDPLARIAEVFLMFDEMNPVTNSTGKSRTFNLTVSDLVHWAGLTTEVVRDEINRLVEKDKIEVFDTHIVVKNISDMKRTIDTRRSQRVL